MPRGATGVTQRFSRVLVDAVHEAFGSTVLYNGRRGALRRLTLEGT